MSLKVANCPSCFHGKKPSFVEQGVDDAKSTAFQRTRSSLFDFSMKYMIEFGSKCRYFTMNE